MLNLSSKLNNWKLFLKDSSLYIVYMRHFTLPLFLLLTYTEVLLHLQLEAKPCEEFKFSGILQYKGGSIVMTGNQARLASTFSDATGHHKFICELVI